jgi:hypothetical protein
MANRRNVMKRRRVLSVVGLIAAYPFATGARAADPVPSSPAYHGQVVAVDHNTPVRGAIVIASVHGGYSVAFGHGGERYLRRIAVRADADGRFTVPAWTWSSGRAMTFDPFGISFSAYAPGFEYEELPRRTVEYRRIETGRILGLFPRGAVKPTEEVRIPMRAAAAGTDERRAKALWAILSIYQVDGDGDAAGDALLLDAMRDEVEGLLARHRLEPNTRDGLERSFEALGRVVAPRSTR